MICGLFSSFDPGVDGLINLKWTTLGIALVLISWQVYCLPSGAPLVQKGLFHFVLSSVKDTMKTPKQVTLILLGLFISILSFNLWGMAPFFFTVSSHLSVNLSLSLPLWGGGLLYSVCNSVDHLLAHTVPLGAPSFLSPLLVIIESVSIMIRPFTLAIRLMANVMAGHLIMGLMGQAFSASKGFLPLSFPLFSGFLAFEMCISMVQAYVFMSLLSLYWKESE